MDTSIQETERWEKMRDKRGGGREKSIEEEQQAGDQERDGRGRASTDDVTWTSK